MRSRMKGARAQHREIREVEAKAKTVAETQDVKAARRREREHAAWEVVRAQELLEENKKRASKEPTTDFIAILRDTSNYYEPSYRSAKPVFMGSTPIRCSNIFSSL